MNSELIAVLEYLESERGIDRDTLISLVEESLESAARKAIGPANELRVKINPKNGNIQAWARLTIVEKVNDPHAEIGLDLARTQIPQAKLGESIDWEVTPENFGRIAAQTAKQTIMQRLRQVEKSRVCDEFQDQVGQLISGVVRRVERGEVVIDFSRAEGVLRYNERIPGEDYQAGDHITALLSEVNSTRPGASLYVSRSHPDFVRRMFEREVSEIGEGLVKIRAVAREPGYRTKIAVDSDDPKVDPVGACVGLRGNRVKTVVRELAGEKVDIIRWDENIKTFVTNALQPAKLSGVRVDEKMHEVVVFVPDDQLSLAIGRKGQNARLAAKLTGWRIDINKEEKPEELGFEDKIQRAVATLAEDLQINLEIARRLVSSGFLTVDGVVAATPEDIAQIDGIDSQQAEAIIRTARQRVDG